RDAEGGSMRRTLLAGVLLLVFALPAAAQLQHTGTIVGKVVDPNAAVLPGVAVEISGPALLRPESTVTDDRGGYRFILQPIGTYKLTFSLQGFATMLRDQI